MMTDDFSDKNLFGIKQVVKKTGISHTSVSRYSRRLNVAVIKGVRYFSETDIKKMCFLYKKKPYKKGKDITGKKINHLTALENTGKLEIVDNNTGYSSYVWKWKCECGKKIEAPLSRVLDGHPTSCGCISKKIKRQQFKHAISFVKWYGDTNIDRLRMTTRCKVQKNNKTGINGINIKYMNNKKYFLVRIGIKKKNIHVGYFKTLEEAIKARELAEIKYHDPIINEYESIQEIRKKIKKEVEFFPIPLNKENLTLFGVKFPDLDTLEKTANAIGSNMFEGFEPTPKGIEMIRDYVTDKITLQELIKLIKEKAYL